MKTLLREYGLIAGLVVISVSGYLIFSQNKEDLLAYSLDVLGTRLVSLLDDEQAKVRVSQAFDRFESQVLNNEVSPDQVQMIAVNVLNLTSSGARLSPEEAELVFSFQPETGANTLPVLENEPPTAPSYATSTDRSRIGQDLEAMLRFADAAGTRDSTQFFYRFESGRDGIQVVIDPDFSNFLDTEAMRQVKRTLDSRKLVRWDSTFIVDFNRSAERFENQQKRLLAIESSELARGTRAIEGSDFQLSERVGNPEGVQSGEKYRVQASPEWSSRVKMLAHLRRLQSLGATVALDTTALSLEINTVITNALREADLEMQNAGVSIRVRTDSLQRRPR